MIIQIIKFSTLLLLPILFAAGCSSCKDDTVPSNGLVAYYKFNLNAQDDSPYYNHGTANGVQYVTDRKGNENNAVYFDGIDDYIKVPHSGYINFGNDQDFTISLWVKYGDQKTTATGDNDILSKWEGGYPFVVRLNNQTAKPPYGAPGKWYAARWDGANGGGADGPPIDDQQFHHIIFMKKGTLLYGYTDGIQTSEGPDNTIKETKNDAPLFIGARKSGANNKNFTGAIDDLRIYNRALSEDEIKTLFEE